MRKSATVYVLDVSASMASPPLENYGSSFTLAGASKLDVSVDVLQRMMSPKVHTN